MGCPVSLSGLPSIASGKRRDLHMLEALHVYVFHVNYVVVYICDDTAMLTAAQAGIHSSRNSRYHSGNFPWV